MDWLREAVVMMSRIWPRRMAKTKTPMSQEKVTYMYSTMLCGMGLFPMTQASFVVK